MFVVTGRSTNIFSGVHHLTVLWPRWTQRPLIALRVVSPIYETIRCYSKGECRLGIHLHENLRTGSLKSDSWPRRLLHRIFVCLVFMRHNKPYKNFGVKIALNCSDQKCRFCLGPEDANAFVHFWPGWIPAWVAWCVFGSTWTSPVSQAPHLLNFFR